MTGGPILAALLAAFDEAERAALAEILERVELPAGASIIEEGGVDRALYIVLAGAARVIRAGVEVATLTPGQHFGELALILGRPRAATVVALEPLVAARLSVDGYLALARKRPELALRLIGVLVGGVADRLLEITDSVGALLRERSFPRRAAVPVRLGGAITPVPTGTPIGAVLPSSDGGRPVLAGLLDRRAVSLTWPLSSACALEPLTADHPEGHRVLHHSVGLVLLEAAHLLRPPARLQLSHSQGPGQRVIVDDPGGRDLATLAAELDVALRRLVEADRPLREEGWTVDEAREHFVDRGWPHAAELLATWQEPTVLLASYGEVYALSPGPLVARTGALGGAHLVADGGGLLLLHPSEPGVEAGVLAEARALSRQNAELVSPQERWLGALAARSVGAFNRACVAGDVAGIIRVCEGFHERRVGEIADHIRAWGGRIVCIAGPSSAGKTTFIKRLRVQLQVTGLTPVGLSLDDYYVDRERTPRDAGGEYDFEALAAVQTELLAEDLERLLRGERVRTARFDFASGRSQRRGGLELALAPDTVLMLEGIHGLNPRLLEGLPGAAAFRVFVSPLVQLPFDRLARVHSSDVRLLRRIVRDRRTRNYDATATIARWPSVRAGERKHIFPYQGAADAVFDSSLVYEPAVIKVFAQRYLLEVPQAHPAYTTAFRLLRLLERFVTIYPDHVPPTSILREFIGGTGFEY